MDTFATDMVSAKPWLSAQVQQLLFFMNFVAMRVSDFSNSYWIYKHDLSLSTYSEHSGQGIGQEASMFVGSGMHRQNGTQCILSLSQSEVLTLQMTHGQIPQLDLIVPHFRASS